MVKSHLLSSSHAVHAAFFVGGLYKFVELLRTFQRSFKEQQVYVYKYIYEVYMLKWNYLYQEYCLSYWIFFKDTFF